MKITQAKKQHILIIDDDKKIRKLLSKFLGDNGFITNSAENTQIAYEFIERFKFDLLILDIMMPNETGIEFAMRLKKNEDTPPILMLTAMSETENIIKGLESGADDYLSKPFEPKELLLRAKNIIKHTQEYPQHKVRFSDLEFDLNSKILTINNKIISLTSSETFLMMLLCKNMGKLVSRQEISKHMDITNERSVDVQINRLRHKIEENAKQPKYLRNIRGKGYIIG